MRRMSYEPFDFAALRERIGSRSTATRSWRRSGTEIVAAAYGGVRLHPVLLARAAWSRVPDAGASALDAELVPCDDLGPPGDVDFTDEVPERLKPWSSRDP